MLRDRQHLAEDGIMIVVMCLDRVYGELAAGPDIVSRGFVYVKESDELMEEIIATAFRLKGSPYLWGGMSPKGVDCSGLVRWSCLMNGILLPRNASQMISCGDEVPLTLPQDGNAPGIDNLQRGDFVFFGTPARDGAKQRVTHVGIYIGNNRIIHSSHLVRVNSLIPGDEDYYENAHKLIAARRL